MEKGFEIEAALDERHLAARRAFMSKDLNAYQMMFSKHLHYTQCNGKMIDRHRLMEDVATQFKTLHSFASSFERETLDINGTEVEETLLQTAMAEATAFGLLRRLWQVDRRSRYTWVVEDGDLRIVRVTVLSETTGSRWKIGKSGRG